MKPIRAALILPVENQVRELESKLLLACAAAERGLRVFIGSRRLIDIRISTFPRALYLSKSMTSRGVRMLQIINGLGHEVVSLDEEAMVHYTPEEYYRRRVAGDAMREVSLLLAWGSDNAELFRKHPEYPGVPVEITGNPRGDLLREELRPLFAPTVDEIRARYGDFVLVNTNFSGVNAYFGRMGFLMPGTRPGDSGRFGLAGRRYSPDFAEGLAKHKHALFDHFKRMIPRLAEALPERAIVVRPHPTELREPWLEATEGLDNVHVVHEGNVVPWLLASRLLVHNGCTTALEAFAMGVPAASYQPTVSDRFDLEVPNALSHRCTNFEGLLKTTESVLRGEMGFADTEDRRELLARYLGAQDGPLASDRIADALLAEAQKLSASPRPTAATHIRAWLRASYRRAEKAWNARKPMHRNNPGYQRHRYSGTTLDQVQTFVSRLQRVLGRFQSVDVRMPHNEIFELSRRDA